MRKVIRRLSTHFRLPSRLAFWLRGRRTVERARPRGGGVSGATFTTSKSLIAARLLTQAKLSATLGQPASKVEDDGGVPAPSGGLQSVAKVVTNSGTSYTLTPTSLLSASDVKQRYKNVGASESGSQTSVKAGDAGAVVDNEAYIWRDSQILTIQSELGGTDEQSLEQANIKGGEISAQESEHAANLSKLATAAGTAMTRIAESKSLVALPSGAKDPCPPGGAAVVAKLYGVKYVTTSYQSADPLPGLMCAYQYTGGEVDIIFLTRPQLAKAAPATTRGRCFSLRLRTAPARSRPRRGTCPMASADWPQRDDEYTFGYGKYEVAQTI